MNGKKVLALIVSAAMLASLTACGGSAGGKDDKGKSSEKDKEQYINVTLSAEPTTLDPTLRTDAYSSELLINTMEGLIRIEQRDNKYKICPGDAEKWEHDDQMTKWTFHLGKDRKWNDGTPVTAQQYVYSLRRSADPKTGCPNSYFLTPIVNYDAISKGEKNVEELGVKALDEHTLEIDLAQPMPSFLESTDGSIFYPQREDLVKKYGEKYGTDKDKLAYNGPFVIDKWTHNSSISLKKNEQYWDAKNVDLTKVNYQILSDVSTVKNAYDSGQIDVITVASQEDLDKYKSDEQNVYTKTSGGQITFSFYNTKDKVFQNEKIREAFTLGLDPVELNEMAFGNLREPLYGWIAPAMTVGDESMRKKAGDTLKTFRKELKKEGKTPKDLLVEGMTELGLGSDPSKLDVTFSLAGTGDWFHTFGEYLQQAYKESLGVNLKIDFSEWGIFQNNLQNGKFQIGFMSWGAYYNDPYDMLSLNLSNINGLFTGWSNPEYDKLVNAAVQETDNQKRMDEYIKAETILLKSYATAPVCTNVQHQFTKKYVHDKYAEYGKDTLYFIHSGWKNTYTAGR